LSFEYSEKNGEPFYPIPNEDNKKQYSLYKNESKKIESVLFCGRLAEYQYYNMDQVVANTLNIFDKIQDD
jgi:UDP-galactopyranose mutase